MPQRSSSSNLYDYQWMQFAVFCDSKGWIPHKATSVQVSEYLTHLFVHKDLLPSTIRVHRAAITSVLAFEDYDPSQDRVLRNLMSRFALEKPRVRRSVPPWNLDLVLAQLLKPPFLDENGSDYRLPLHLLLWKTTFLLTLASGARASDIHALSRQPERFYIRTKSDGSEELHLWPVAGFLGKTQVPDELPKPFVIPSTSHLVTDYVDRLLCPVRVAKIYEKRTQKPDFLQGRKRLLLHFKPNILVTRTAHISQWIVDCITTCYENASNSSCQNLKLNAHEVRAMAHSFAYFNNVSLSEVLEGARWKCASTFSNHYLRDMSVSTDGISKLGPIVVALRVFNT